MKYWYWCYNHSLHTRLPGPLFHLTYNSIVLHMVLFSLTILFVKSNLLGILTVNQFWPSTVYHDRDFYTKSVIFSFWFCLTFIHGSTPYQVGGFEERSSRSLSCFLGCATTEPDLKSLLIRINFYSTLNCVRIVVGDLFRWHFYQLHAEL